MELCLFYRKYPIILTYVNDYVIVSHKQEKIILSIESLNNGPEIYALPDEVDISNYLGVNIKKKSDGSFELSQSYLVDKIINHVGITVYARPNSRETPSGKPLLHKGESSLGRKCVWN